MLCKIGLISVDVTPSGEGNADSGFQVSRAGATAAQSVI